MTETTEKLLRDCRHKLELYRKNSSGEYLGGVEYTDLIARIDAALSASAPDAAKHSLLTVQQRIDKGDILGARAEFNAGVKANFGKQTIAPTDAALIDEIIDKHFPDFPGGHYSRQLAIYAFAEYAQRSAEAEPSMYANNGFHDTKEFYPKDEAGEKK